MRPARRRGAGIRRGVAASWLALVASLSVTVAARAQALPRRAPDAPRFQAPLRLPALPAEYLTHGHAGIRFAYSPSARDAVRELMGSADEERAWLRRQLGRPVLASVEVRVAPHDTDFARITPPAPLGNEARASLPDEGSPRRSGSPSAWRPPAGATVIAFSDAALLVKNLDAIRRDDDLGVAAAFRHGLAHLALDEAAGGQSIPRWLQQGYAIHAGQPRCWSRTLSLGWESVRGNLPSLPDLSWRFVAPLGPSPLERAQAADVVHDLLAAEGGARFRNLITELERGTPPHRAMQTAYGATLDDVEHRWRQQLAWRGVFVPLLVAGLFVAAGAALAWRWLRRWEARRARRRSSQREDERHRRLPDRVAIIQVERDAESKLVADSVSLSEPPDSGVPKVSHDGRWHTLH